jgi:Family of unknown function (DUF6356)
VRINNLLRRFREHPAAVGESYGEHCFHAASFGWTMLRGALACLVHAVFPWICTTTGSQAVTRLHNRMVLNRSKSRKDEMHTLDPLDRLAENI